MKIRKRIAVLGGGPIGLEAALAARAHGHRVNVFERGEVGDSVRRWGHVKMFSPFGMNVSLRGIERLRQRQQPLPDPDALLTGTEFVAQYLTPLGESLGDEIVHTNVEVVALGRSEFLKHEPVGGFGRMETPFRLLLRRGEREWIEEAEVIFDCTGTFQTPNHLGDGGIPAPGEAAARALISYGVPDVLGRLRRHFEDRRVLVVGAGYSAATAVRDLVALKNSAAKAQIIWAARRRVSIPCTRLEDDPLPERDALAQQVNQIVEDQEIVFLRESGVLAVEQKAEELVVTLGNGNEQEKVTVDRIIAAVGFRPDLELTRELQVQTSYLTEGFHSGNSSWSTEKDEELSAAKLVHPEPGYFSLGMKSHGRASDFLLRTGRAQVEAVLDWLEKN